MAQDARGHEASAQFRFQVIGPFAVWRDGRRLDDHEVASRKGRTLLKVLLLAADQPVRHDRLVSALWPERSPEDAVRNLASLVSRLRRVFGTDVIVAAGATYRLRTGPGVTVDLREVERLAEEARAHLQAAAPALAWAAAERASVLLGEHDLLEGDAESDWADEARTALGVLRRDLRRCGWDAALELGDAESARSLAERSLSADPLDEEACRALMVASRLRGESAEGLLAYERLRSALADELGVAPSGRTQQVHLALLREDDQPDSTPRSEPSGPIPAAPEPSGPTPAAPTGTRTEPGRAPRSARSSVGGGELVGRDRELATLRQWWADATQGHARLVLVTGEAGIGKTRLVEAGSTVASDVGGMVIRARCYEAERSLFLGPIVEILASLVRHTPPEQLRDLVQPWEGTLAQIVPEISEVLGVSTYEPAIPRVERRRAFEAISALLRGWSARQPLLVFLDDLHQAGSSTIELLHYLQRHVAGGRLLVVATLRIEEGAEVVRTLEEVAHRIDLGPLSDDAVAELARSAGASEMTPRILALTRGHTLSVIETLHALEEADADLAEPPVPESLRVAVLHRLERAGSHVEELLRGAAILGSTFDVEAVGSLLDLAAEEIIDRVGHAITARLLVEDGPMFAFSNDLMREIVYETTPRPVRVSRHRRAARLFASQPEAMAMHASAAQDWPQALEAWLEAAATAAGRYANRDAEQLLARAIEAAESAGDQAGAARARLARGEVREVLGDYTRAFQDLEAAADLARSCGRPDLQAAALRALGGDVIVGMGRPSTDCVPYLEAGLDVAVSAQLGELEVELLGRLAVVWTNRARFDLAIREAERALERARELATDRAMALALDAIKNASAYMGDLDRLRRVLPELEGILRPAGDLTLLQWCVFESMIPALAEARWDTAAVLLDRALDLNRRTGHRWGSLFVAHRSWLRRQQGAYGRAIADAHTARESELSVGHPWWSSFSEAMLGWVLSDVGAHDEAVACLDRGAAAAERDGMETYLIRCVSHLALACWRRGDRVAAEEHLDRAEGLLAGVTAPPERAFLHGAHAYAAVARLRIARGETGAAVQLLDVVRRPAEVAGWREIVATDRLLRGRCELVVGDRDAARPLLEEAVAAAEDVGLLPLAWEARVALAHVEPSASHERVAAAHLDVLADSLPQGPVRARFLRFATQRTESVPGEPLG